jgi:methionine transaminase
MSSKTQKTFCYGAKRTAMLSPSKIDILSIDAKKHGAIDLCLGAPEAPWFSEFTDAFTQEVMCRHGYGDAAGEMELREVIAGTRSTAYSSFSASDVTITSGATEALYVAIQSLIDIGDEVIVPIPAYESYVPLILMAGGVPRFLHLEVSELGVWSFPVDLLRNLITPKTRILLLNSPHNPTGMTLSHEEIKNIADLCDSTKILIISDEVYEHFVYEGEHLSPSHFSSLKERTIVIGSFSKTLGIPGWRMGYILSPHLLSPIIQKVHEAITSGVWRIPQQMIAKFLASRLGDFHNLRMELTKRRDALMQAFVNIGFPDATPPSGLYLYIPSLKNHCEVLKTESSIVCSTKHTIASVPNTVFFDSHRKYMRVSFAKQIEVKKAIDLLTS